MTAFTWSLFGLLTTVVAGMFGLAGVGLTWIRDGFRDVRVDLQSGLGAVNARLDTTNSRIDETNSRLDRHIDHVNARIDGLTSEMHVGFAAVRADIAVLDRRLANVEGT